jgi:putative tricarboxylic transport membrane protein
MERHRDFLHADVKKEKEAVMKKGHGLIFIMVSLFLFVFGLASAPQAQASYPEQDKIIDFYHHAAPGTAPDLFLRTIADILNRKGIVKPKIQVQTRQGGSSAVALNYLNSKAGDPYVQMAWTTAPLLAMLRGTTALKIERCNWLGTFIEDPNVLIVNYNSPYKTLADLLADAKANPKKVSVGINSIGGSEHLQAIRLERAAGVKFNITAFEFAPTMVIGGHIDVGFGNTAETSGHVKAKRARVLAAVSPHRLPYFQDVPTLIEQGVNASFTQYRGLFAGPDYPAEAIRFWDNAFAKMVKTPEFAEFVKKADVVANYKSSAETKIFLDGYIKELERDLKYLQENK